MEAFAPPLQSGDPMGAPVLTLEECLRRAVGNRIQGLQIEVSEQGVRLRGRTNSYYTKQMAQEAILKNTGFTILANEIEVS